MHPIKIVFFDIDGTLIDMQTKRITPATLETLRRLRAGGVKICLATGRSPITLPDIPDVKFDAYLTFNGSLCYTETETIFSTHAGAQRHSLGASCGCRHAGRAGRQRG